MNLASAAFSYLLRFYQPSIFSERQRVHDKSGRQNDAQTRCRGNMVVWDVQEIQSNHLWPAGIITAKPHCPIH